MKRSKKRVCYNDDVVANKHHVTIVRSDPTLQTIAASILDSENKLFNHYHRYLRDDEGSNWQGQVCNDVIWSQCMMFEIGMSMPSACTITDSIEIGDVLEFNYSSTFKSRVNAVQSSLREEARPRVTLLHDMPQWIPVVIVCCTHFIARHTP